MSSKKQMKNHLPHQTYGVPLVWSLDGTSHLVSSPTGAYDLVTAIKCLEESHPTEPLNPYVLMKCVNAVIKLYDHRIKAFWDSPEVEVLKLREAFDKAQKENDGHGQFPSSPYMPRITRVTVDDEGGGDLARSERELTVDPYQLPYSGVFHLWENEVWDEHNSKFMPAEGVEEGSKWMEPIERKKDQPPHLSDEYNRMSTFFRQDNTGNTFGMLALVNDRSGNINGIPAFGGAYKFGMWWKESGLRKRNAAGGARKFRWEEQVKEPLGFQVARDAKKKDGWIYNTAWGKLSKSYAIAPDVDTKEPIEPGAILEQAGWTWTGEGSQLVSKSWGLDQGLDCRRRLFSRHYYSCGGFVLRLRSLPLTQLKKVDSISTKTRSVIVDGPERVLHYFDEGRVDCEGVTMYKWKGVIALSHGTRILDPFEEQATLDFVIESRPNDYNQDWNMYAFRANNLEEAKEWKETIYYLTDEGLLTLNNLDMEDSGLKNDGSPRGSPRRSKAQAAKADLKMASDPIKGQLVERFFKKGKPDFRRHPFFYVPHTPKIPDEDSGIVLDANGEAGSYDSGTESGYDSDFNYDDDVIWANMKSFSTALDQSLHGQHDGNLVKEMEKESRTVSSAVSASVMSCMLCGMGSSPQMDHQISQIDAQEDDTKKHHFHINRIRAWIKSLKGDWIQAFPPSDSTHASTPYYYNVEKGLSSWKLPPGARDERTRLAFNEFSSGLTEVISEVQKLLVFVCISDITSAKLIKIGNPEIPRDGNWKELMKSGYKTELIHAVHTIVDHKRTVFEDQDRIENVELRKEGLSEEEITALEKESDQLTREMNGDLTAAKIDMRLAFPLVGLIIGMYKVTSHFDDPSQAFNPMNEKQTYITISEILFNTSDWGGENNWGQDDIWFLLQSLHYAFQWCLVDMRSPHSMLEQAIDLQTAVEEWRHETNKRIISSGVNIDKETKFTELDLEETLNSVHENRNDNKDLAKVYGMIGLCAQAPYDSSALGGIWRRKLMERRATRLAKGLHCVEDEVARRDVGTKQQRLNAFDGFMALKLVFEAFMLKEDHITGVVRMPPEEVIRWGLTEEPDDDEDEKMAFLLHPPPLFRSFGTVEPLTPEMYRCLDSESIFHEIHEKHNFKFPEVDGVGYQNLHEKKKRSPNTPRKKDSVKDEISMQKKENKEMAQRFLNDAIISKGTRFTFGECITYTSTNIQLGIDKADDGIFDFVTEGGRYIIKSMTRDEALNFQRVQVEYIKYVTEHPDTLLDIVLGVYKYIGRAQVIYFAIMVNYAYKARKFDEEAWYYTRHHRVHDYKEEDLPESDTRSPVPGEQLISEDQDRLIEAMSRDLEFLESQDLVGYHLQVCTVRFDNAVLTQILQHKKGGEAVKLAELINPCLPHLTRGGNLEALLKTYRANMKKLIRCIKQGHLRSYAKDLIHLDAQVEAFVLDYVSEGMFSSRNQPDRQVIHIAGLFGKSEGGLFRGKKTTAEHALSIKTYASFRWPGAWGIVLESDDDEYFGNSSGDDETEAEEQEAARKARGRDIAR